MILQLKNPATDQFPPGGGFGFTDPKTGMRFNGWEGTPEMTASKISAHRRANPNLYPSSEGHWFVAGEIIQEIYSQKKSTHPHLFIGGPDKTPGVKSASSDKGSCVCGSSDVSPIYCKSCSGQRIVGYKCNSCGKERE